MIKPDQASGYLRRAATSLLMWAPAALGELHYPSTMSVDFSTLNELEALAGSLDQQRDALVRKVDGLSDADARLAPTVSTLSLLSLLKHCAIWEERWFQGVVAGRPLADGWPDTRHNDCG